MSEQPPTGSDAYRITRERDPYESFNVALAYQVGDVIYVSGQAAYDDDGEIVGAGDFDAQAAQVFRNLEQVLDAAGSGFDGVVKLTILLTDMAHYPAIVALRDKHFSEPYPADTIAEVSAFPRPELMLEIDAIALVGGRRLNRELDGPRSV